MDDLGYAPPFIEGRQKRSSKKGIVILFLVIVLLVPLFLGGFHVFGNLSFPSATPTPLPTSVSFPTDTPIPIASPTATTPPTPTPKGQTRDTISGLDKAKLTVLVENGSGKVGAANKAAQILKEAGYKITGTKNADAYDYLDVTISVKAQKAAYLPLLKQDLSSVYTVTDTRATLDDAAATDALVIVGK
jgi:hypothetical protein